MIHAFQSAVSYLCFAVLAVIACVCFFVGFRQVGMWLRANLRPISLVVFAAAAVIATCEAQKRGNEAAGAPLPRGEYVVSITPRSIGEAALLPLSGAETNAKWRAHGAFEDVFYLPASNWWARMPGGGWIDRLRIRSSGGFQVKGASDGSWTNYPPPFAQKLSLAPEANWSLPSLFWHAMTPSNTLVMTWLGGLYARSHTNQVDFQAELFNDGSYDYRYADHTEHFAASLPFDLDGDGLENSVDPDPLTPGSDAHGTNAEWYNTVCSNVFASVEGGGTGTTGILPVDDVSVLPWREGVNSNAYYFVDVVAERGPAPIYFTGDRDSRLGNPVVVTLAGVTNRVPLLIGIDYAVTSDTPFSVSFPVDYMHPTVTTNGVANYNVRWPLNFVFTEDIGASNRVYTVTVEPYDPGGVLEWDVNVPMRGGACDCVHYGSRTASFTCSSTCTCGAGCRARGRYLFEVANFPLEGGECRCGFNDPPWDYPPSPHNPDDGPSLNITLSESAVIFESAYEDSPGVTKPRRSTRVRLTVDAYGGPVGGTLSLSGQNISRLVALCIGGVPLPLSKELAAGEIFHATCIYEGVAASGEANDVVVSGILTPGPLYNPLSDEARLTAVKVELEAEYVARDNHCQNRHTYGVGEKVKFSVTPALAAIKLRAVKADTTDDETPYDTFGSDSYFQGVSNADASQARTYICPATASRPAITVKFAGTEFRPIMSIVEPSEVVSPTASGSWDVGFGNVGFGCLKVANYIGPFYVSFEGVKVGEIPCYDAIPPTGFFASTNYTGQLTHGVGACSGRQYKIKADNYWRHDEAGSDRAIRNWDVGTLVWKNPIGWTRFQSEDDTNITIIVNCDYERYRDANSRPLLIGGRTDAYTQTFSIESSGTTILEKFGWRMTRSRWSFSGTVERVE